MVWHQAPGQYIGKRQNMIVHFFQKVQIISMSKENFLVIISLIVDMVNIVDFKNHGSSFRSSEPFTETSSM